MRLHLKERISYIRFYIAIQLIKLAMWIIDKSTPDGILLVYYVDRWVQDVAKNLITPQQEEK